MKLKRQIESVIGICWFISGMLWMGYHMYREDVIKERFRSVKVGMSEENVTSLQGEPDRVNLQPGGSDGEPRTLSSWNEWNHKLTVTLDAGVVSKVSHSRPGRGALAAAKSPLAQGWFVLFVIAGISGSWVERRFTERMDQPCRGARRRR